MGLVVVVHNYTLFEDLKIGEEIAERYFHCAGNDSKYNLRVLLLDTVQRNTLSPEK